MSKRTQEVWASFQKGGLAAITQEDLNEQRRLTVAISIQDSHVQVLQHRLKEAQIQLKRLKDDCAHLTYDGKSAYTVPNGDLVTCSICGRFYE